MKNRTRLSPRRLLLASFLLLFVLLGQPMVATAQNPSEEPTKKLSESVSLLEIYQQGGWTMHVLLLCSIGTIACVVYCFIQISTKKMNPKSLHDQLVQQMRSRDVNHAFSLCQSANNSLGRIVSSALLKVNFDRDKANKDSMDQAAADSLDQEETQQMLWVNYLNVFATIAPMIGLFGTVTGMITSFNDLKQGATDPNDFAGGIGEAMATTAGGLLVGIPSMFFFFFFRNKLMGIMSGIQKNASFLIDVLSGEVQIDDGSPTSAE